MPTYIYRVWLESENGNRAVIILLGRDVSSVLEEAKITAASYRAEFKSIAGEDCEQIGLAYENGHKILCVEFTDEL